MSIQEMDNEKLNQTGGDSLVVRAGAEWVILQAQRPQGWQTTKVFCRAPASNAYSHHQKSECVWRGQHGQGTGELFWVGYRDC